MRLRVDRTVVRAAGIATWLAVGTAAAQPADEPNAPPERQPAAEPEPSSEKEGPAGDDDRDEADGAAAEPSGPGDDGAAGSSGDAVPQPPSEAVAPEPRSEDAAPEPPSEAAAPERPSGNDAPPSAPAPAQRRGDTDVDIVTSAGRRADEAPEYPPSIVLEEEQVRWDPRWQTFELEHWVATGILLAGSFGSLAIPPAPDRWDNANAFDLEARNVLRLPTISAQNTARDASDVLLTLSVNHALIDTLVVTWWGHDADTVAYNMALISVEALAFNTAVNGLIAGFASRERPYGRNLCVGRDNTELADCRSSNRFRSFFSGHTSSTFTVAGLTCMHHAQMPLYGGGGLDAVACAASVGMAGATGVMRIMGDKHWLSDVLVGAAVGSFSGLAIPYLLHYRAGDLPEAGDDVSIQLVPTPNGGAMTGVF